MSQVIFCDRRNAFAKFPENEFHFSWQAQRFGDFDVNFARQAQHMRRLFCAACSVQIACLGLRQEVTTCKLRGWSGAL